MSEEWHPPTVEELMRLAKQIRHEKSYDGDLPEIICQAAERIAELDGEVAYYRDLAEKENERIIGLLQESQGLEIDIDLLRAALEPFGDIDGEGDEDYTDDLPVTVKFGRCTDYTLKLGDFRRARAALASCDERPSGLRPERAQGDSPPARPDEGGGRPTPSHFPLPLEEKP